MAGSKSGYRSVACRPHQLKPYDAQVKRGGKLTYLGSFTTAEEAALHVARSQEAAALSSKRVAPDTPTLQQGSTSKRQARG